MRKVMIGTPCYSGQVDVWYTNSLVKTINQSILKYDIEITPIWVSFDALIQRARNDTIQLALEGEYDDLVWIDSDIEWQPEWFFKLLEYTYDVVGGTYRKKGDKEEYVLRQFETGLIKIDENLYEVSGLGTGFVKMSRAALQYLWDNSESYIDPKDGKERKMICDVQIIDNSLYSEDIVMFRKLAEGGFKTYLDASMTCNHIGSYKFEGSFENFVQKEIKKQLPRPNRQL